MLLGTLFMLEGNPLCAGLRHSSDIKLYSKSIDLILFWETILDEDFRFSSKKHPCLKLTKEAEFGCAGKIKS
jgi:hypothetical protein